MLGNRLALVVALLLFFATLGLAVTGSRQACDGAYAYPADDAYIHLGIARHLVEDRVWGIDASGFSSTSSSPGWTILLSAVAREAVGATPLGDHRVDRRALRDRGRAPRPPGDRAGGGTDRAGAPRPARTDVGARDGAHAPRRVVDRGGRARRGHDLPPPAGPDAAPRRARTRRDDPVRIALPRARHRGRARDRAALVRRGSGLRCCPRRAGGVRDRFAVARLVRGPEHAHPQDHAAHRRRTDGDRRGTGRRAAPLASRRGGRRRRGVSPRRGARRRARASACAALRRGRAPPSDLREDRRLRTLRGLPGGDGDRRARAGLRGAFVAHDDAHGRRARVVAARLSRARRRREPRAEPARRVSRPAADGAVPRVGVCRRHRSRRRDRRGELALAGTRDRSARAREHRRGAAHPRRHVRRRGCGFRGRRCGRRGDLRHDRRGRPGVRGAGELDGRRQPRRSRARSLRLRAPLLCAATRQGDATPRRARSLPCRPADGATALARIRVPRIRFRVRSGRRESDPHRCARVLRERARAAEHDRGRTGDRTAVGHARRRPAAFARRDLRRHAVRHRGARAAGGEDRLRARREERAGALVRRRLQRRRAGSERRGGARVRGARIRRATSAPRIRTFRPPSAPCAAPGSVRGGIARSLRTPSAARGSRHRAACARRANATA